MRNLTFWNGPAKVDFISTTWAAQDLERMIALTKKYQDRPMDLADASLVVTSEKLGIRQVISIDRDFDIYRRADKKQIENILLR